MGDEGLCAGGFDHHSQAFIEDPPSAFAHLREQCPVVWSDHYGGFWTYARHDDVQDAFRDWRTYTSSNVGRTGSIPPAIPRQQPHIPLELDPPLHGRYRRLVSPVFVQGAIEAIEPELRSIAKDLCERLLGRPRADLVPDLAVPMSATSLAAFMGLPPTHQQQWVAWVRRMFRSAMGDADAERAGQEYAAYIDDLIARRREQPTDDLISTLIASRVDDHELTDREIRGFCVLLLVAGHETTASAIGSSLWYLARDEQARRALRDDPTLTEHAVEEFLRLFPPIQLFGRTAAQDVEKEGHVIEEGALVALAIGSANRDPDAFPDPDRFEAQRRPNRHLAFGYGPHTCIGAHLARLEMRVVIEEFLLRFPDYRLDEQGVSWGPRGDVRGLASLPVVFPTA